MKKYYLLILICVLIISCNLENPDTINLTQQITKRIEILNNSYKFTVIPENLQGKSFDKLKSHIDEVIYSETEIDLQLKHDLFSKLFKEYNVAFAEESDSKTGLLFNLMIGLDDLIFKYLPSRLNFSNYKAVVLPDKLQTNIDETLNLKLYLAVSDTLYESEIKYFDLDSDGNLKESYNLICENGIGQFSIVNRKKGIKKLKGVMIYSNEYGSKDTIDWHYEYEVK
jgi:hypothetical protein